MILSMFTIISVAVSVTCGLAQAPDGRWDGKITYGTLNVPFTIHFESSGKRLTGSFLNGDTQVSSTEGTFEGGRVRLTFGPTGTRLEGVVTDDQLKGTYGSGQQMHPFTATKFCSCGPVPDEGPDISGAWEVPDSNLRLTIRRKGDETLATILHSSSELGPLAGSFDGLAFMLNYFDGARAAVLEIGPRKDGGLDLKLTEPGTDAKKYRAVPATSRR